MEKINGTKLLEMISDGELKSGTRMLWYHKEQYSEPRGIVLYSKGRLTLTNDLDEWLSIYAIATSEFVIINENIEEIIDNSDISW